MSMCRVFSCVAGRGCLLWPVCSLGKTLLAFALLHSVFQGQIWNTEWIKWGWIPRNHRTLPFCWLDFPVSLNMFEQHQNSLLFDVIDFIVVVVQLLVMSDSLQPQRLQHARLPCSSPTPRACSNSCPLSQWCHPTISSSVVPFSSCPQSLTASGSFPMSQFFTSGGQNIEASASASVLPMDIQGDFL